MERWNQPAGAEHPRQCLLQALGLALNASDVTCSRGSAAARTHGHPGQAAEGRTDIFAEATAAAWREDALPHAATRQQQPQQQQQPAATAAPVLLCARAQNGAAQVTFPVPDSRVDAQQGQAQQPVAPVQQQQQQQPSALLCRSPAGSAIPPLQAQSPAAAQQQGQQIEAAAEPANGGAGQTGAAVRQQGEPAPSSNGAAAALEVPEDSWDSDIADFQDAPEEGPVLQQDESEDVQPEHLSPSECAQTQDPCWNCCMHASRP